MDLCPPMLTDAPVHVLHKNVQSLYSRAGSKDIVIDKIESIVQALVTDLANNRPLSLPLRSRRQASATAQQHETVNSADPQKSWLAYPGNNGPTAWRFGWTRSSNRVHR